MHVSTIIVSYNTFALTRVAVQTALEAAPGLDHEIIVVDNDSPDRSAERLRASFPQDQFPGVVIIANPTNDGFSRANNIGAERAQGDVFFFLNPDTVVHGDAIRRLYDFAMSHPNAGAIGPKVLNPDGSIQPSTTRFITPIRLIQHHLPIDRVFKGLDRRSDRSPAGIENVDVIKGCALAIRREVFEGVGGWDESYFMYSEEVELCRSLVVGGYSNYYVNDAVITHHWGASTEDAFAEQQVIQHRSKLAYLRRHHGRTIRIIYRVSGAIGFGLRALAFNLTRKTRADDQQFERRKEAALRLFRWFVLEFS